MLNLSSYFIEQELKKRGYAAQAFYDGDLLLLEKDGRKFYTHSSITLQKATSWLICRDKFLSKEVLLNFGLPTAKGIIITEETIDNISQIQFPVALKPLNLSGGVGIALNINSREEVKDYFKNHPDYKRVLAEEMLAGKDTRVLIVKGSFFAACQREPASVVGDGVSTVLELITKENERRIIISQRQENLGIWEEDIFPILLDSDVETHLSKIGINLASVPKRMEKVFVRANANVASGGSSVDVTDQVCDEIRQLCEKVATSLNMTTVGVDLMSTSLDLPIERQPRAGIVEVNASPGLSLHILTHIGTRRNPVPLIVDEIEESIKNSVR